MTIERLYTGRCHVCDFPLDDHKLMGLVEPCTAPRRKDGDEDHCKKCGHYRAVHATQCFMHYEGEAKCTCTGFVQR